MTGISNKVTQRMIDHLRNSTTDMAQSDLRVPVANFVSNAHADAERALFRRLPLIVAHGSELAAPGSFITRDVLGASLLIVRQDDGTAAAFLNMCRHRRGKVELDAAGSKRAFTCRYHGWTYERNGTLRTVPYEKFFEPIAHAENGLIPVATEERHGFIWVDFSNDSGGKTPRNVAGYLGQDADEQLAAFELDKCIVFLDKSFPLDVNWKLVIDGTIDVLHAQFLHPDTVGKLFQTNAGVWQDYGRHGQLFTARRKLTELVNSGAQIDAAWKLFATNLLIYPNSALIAAPDHIEFWTVWPALDGASKSITNIKFLVRPELLDDTHIARLNKSWEILSDAATKEDWPMEAFIQSNSNAHPEGSYLYGRNEVSCQHLHRQLRADIGDASE